MRLITQPLALRVVTNALLFGNGQAWPNQLIRQNRGLRLTSTSPAAKLRRLLDERVLTSVRRLIGALPCAPLKIALIVLTTVDGEPSHAS